MAAIAAAVGVLAVPARRKRGDEDGRYGYADLVPEGVPEGRSPTSTTSSRTGRRSTSATRSSSSRPGFHTVDFPAKGGKPLGLIAPAGSTSRRPRCRRRSVLVQRAADARLQPGPRAARALRQEGHLHRRQARRVRAAAGAEAEAVHGQVHQGRDVHVLLQHPLGDEGHGQGRVQEPQRPVGEGRRQDAEDSGLLGAEHGQGPDQDQGRGGQRQRRRLRPAWRRVLRDVPRDPDGPGRARRSSSRCRPRPSRSTRRRSAPATPRPSRRATSATWRSTSPTTRCSRRRPSTRAIRRRPVRRP